VHCPINLYNRHPHEPPATYLLTQSATTTSLHALLLLLLQDKLYSVAASK
jgi:hypothetical protein